MVEYRADSWAWTPSQFPVRSGIYAGAGGMSRPTIIKFVDLGEDERKDSLCAIEPLALPVVITNHFKQHKLRREIPNHRNRLTLSPAAQRTSTRSPKHPIGTHPITVYGGRDIYETAYKV